VLGGAAGEVDSDGGIDEGMGKKRGRALAICPVVRAPSGQGEKQASWLKKYMHTHGTPPTHTHTLVIVLTY